MLANVVHLVYLCPHCVHRTCKLAEIARKPLIECGEFGFSGVIGCSALKKCHQNLNHTFSDSDDPPV